MAGVVYSWFNDVAFVELFFDADLGGAAGVNCTPSLRVVPPRDPLTEEPGSVVVYEHPLFAAGALVSGFARITPVSEFVHSGVTAVCSVSLATSEEAEEGGVPALFNEEIDLLPPGKLSSVTDVPFLFPGTGTMPLPESYEGELMSIRHSVALNIKRPWYTFDITASAPFHCQRVFDVPDRAAYIIDTTQPVVEEGGMSILRDANAHHVSASASAAVKAAAGHADAVLRGTPAAAAAAAAAVGAPKSGDSTPTSGIELPPMHAAAAGGLARAASASAPGMPMDEPDVYQPQSVHIASGAAEGIVFSFNKGCFELSEQLLGDITFSNIVTPIVMVRLAVVKMEYARGKVADTILFDESIMDARRWKAAQFLSTPSPAHVAALAHTGEEAATPRSAGAAAASAAVTSAHVMSEEEVEAFDYASLPASAWMPSSADLDVPEPHPDVPILGDVNLAVELDFSQLEAVTPTIVLYDVDEDDAERARAGHKKKEEFSVRYFVRVTVYHDFSPMSRMWAASEVLLYRHQLYGNPLDAYLLTRPMYENPTPSARGAPPILTTSAPSPGASSGGFPSPAGSPLRAVLPAAGGGSPNVRKISLGGASASASSSGAVSPHMSAMDLPPSSMNRLVRAASSSGSHVTGTMFANVRRDSELSSGSTPRIIGSMGGAASTPRLAAMSGGAAMDELEDAESGLSTLADLTHVSPLTAKPSPSRAH